uniref:Major capsid protein L1 n=1 Tax=Human papillomavirus TaxID=10566 RepID=A0A385PKY3_9PAPI|nr:MAG: L1 protein [Human papillomavirus]
MATWSPNTGKLYLPPAAPVARVLSTDEYIIPTNIYFHANTDRLLTVGHPYFDITDSGDPNIVTIPKVSANQFRVFRLELPDPNKFALVEKSVYNPERERLVWRLQGIQIDRGGPLGIGTTGHPLFDKQGDTENPNKYFNVNANGTENRQNVSFDPKQNQLIIVGCAPAVGQHWDITDPCDKPRPAGTCPPIKLVHTKIQDGDMCDIGMGAVNFSTFSESRSDAPLEIINSICKWPDFINMSKDRYGDSLFFYGKREQLYVRHMFCRDGVVGDSIPEDNNVPHRFIISQDTGTPPDTGLGSSAYYPTPSGSLVSSETQLFNRPYWVHRAQGNNNGIAWGNNLFVTIVDNTHNTNFILSVYKEDTPMQATYKYKSTDFRHFMRHVEEYEMELVLQLCKVPLTADVLAHLNAMNPTILDDWQLAFVPSPPQGLEDTYRFLQSLATMCPKDAPKKEKEDPYKDLVFWNINLTDKFTSELDQTPLGKKFLYQMGMISKGTAKQTRSLYSTTTPTVRRRTVKRKRSVATR